MSCCVSDGRDREVTFLVADLVAEVGHFIAAGVPNRFFGINGVEGAVGFGIILDVIENEELSFGTEHGGIGDLGAIADISRPRCAMPRGSRL